MKIGIGILLLFFVTSLQAQNIIGKVIDNKKKPVDGATIVLQAIDSTYINASISNVDGTFVLDSCLLYTSPIRSKVIKSWYARRRKVPSL